MKRGGWIDALTIVLILVLGYQVARLSARVSAIEKSESVGDALENATLLPMQARLVTGASRVISPDRARVIFYFSPKCGSCKQNLPAWREIATRLGAANVLAVFPDVDAETIAAVPGYLLQGGLGGVEAVQLDAAQFTEYRMHEVPRTLLVDTRGRVTHVWRGRVDADAVLKAWGERQRT